MPRKTPRQIPAPEELASLRSATLQALRTVKPDLPRHLSSEELAPLFGVKPPALKRAVWEHGHYHGLQPLKIGRRIIWPMV